MASGRPLQIVAVPAFADNYLWLVHDPDSGETAVVDPGDGAAVLAEADARGWIISQVWTTHWHPDHTGAMPRSSPLPARPCPRPPPKPRVSRPSMSR